MQWRLVGDVCVFITAVPITKLLARGGGGDGGHVLRETTSRGRCDDDDVFYLFLQKQNLGAKLHIYL